MDNKVKLELDVKKLLEDIKVTKEKISEYVHEYSKNFPQYKELLEDIDVTEFIKESLGRKEDDLSEKDIKNLLKLDTIIDLIHVETGNKLVKDFNNIKEFTKEKDYLIKFEKDLNTVVLKYNLDLNNLPNNLAVVHTDISLSSTIRFTDLFPNITHINDFIHTRTCNEEVDNGLKELYDYMELNNIKFHVSLSDINEKVELYLMCVRIDSKDLIFKIKKYLEAYSKDNPEFSYRCDFISKHGHNIY